MLLCKPENNRWSSGYHTGMPLEFVDSPSARMGSDVRESSHRNPYLMFGLRASYVLLARRLNVTSRWKSP